MKASPTHQIQSAPERRANFAAPRLLAHLSAVVLIQGTIAQAEITGPYTADEQTLHLWHLNEAAAPVADVVHGLDLHQLGDGATLGNESYVGPKKFGTALGTYVGNPAVPPGCAGQSAGLSAQPLENGRADNVPVRYAGAANAFTYEAVVRVDFDPAASFGPDGWGRGKTLFMQIISGDADENADRAFQFRLAPIGTLNGNGQPLLEFINLNQGNDIQSLTAPIPTDGPDAIRVGNWYHLAVSYDGQADHPDNLRFYWTQVHPERSRAKLIGSGQMTHHLPAGCSPDFAIGQTGRQSPVTKVANNNFVGLIDEVRISGVARSPGQMLFGEMAIVSKPSAVETNSPPTLAAASRPAPVALEATKPTRLEAVTMMNGAIARGPTNQPRLAIMFSCRESDGTSLAVVETLKVQQAKASFFVTSDFLRRPANRLLVQSLLAQGHYVGPQADSWTQFAVSGAAPAAGTETPLPAETEAHFKQLAAFGVRQKDARFFLPTFDQLNPATATRAREWGLTMVAGTPGTLSFATATVEGTMQFVPSQAILESILKCEQESGGLNGFLLLFQLDSGARQTDRFSSRFAELIGALRNRGYEFVRADELLEAPPVRPTLVDVKRR
jgi:peptidoglycan/xylan/chitin deacetylase (PgdA/CDA1 family)